MSGPVIEIPFLGGAYEGRSKSLNAQQSVNLFPVSDQQEAKTILAMYGTPGTVDFVDTGTAAVVRGIHVMGVYLYAVVGADVYEITVAGVATKLGVITTATGHVGMADNGTQLLIVDGTDKGHIVTTGAIADITDGDYPVATGCTFFDGYFIVSVKDTGRIQICKLYDGTSWDALDFATAEASPDALVGIGTTRQNIWLFGEYSIEVYYNAGDPDFPFQRVPGAIIDLGCESATSITEIEGVLYWLSNKKTVVRGEGYGFTTVSSPGIDYQISTYATTDDAVGYTYSIEGRTFYVLNFATEDKTWVLDTKSGQWHEWQSYI
ncbi:MAG: hypothetical protein J7K40_09420 [candidate division Zixibacteria bacterium]|nr:hypothetical protein [candidate division Zixibacteria bacterium]